MHVRITQCLTTCSIFVISDPTDLLAVIRVTVAVRGMAHLIC